MAAPFEVVSFAFPDNRVAARRLALHLSQDDCARFAGVSKTTLVNVENGGGCQLETAWRLALALGVAVGDLFTKPTATLVPARRR